MEYRSIGAALALGALMLAPQSAAAQADPIDADLRCLVVGFTLGGSADLKTKQAGVPFTLYYLGRLDARAPRLDIEKRLGDLAGAMFRDDIRREGVRCASELGKRGTELRRIAEALQARPKPVR